MAKVDFPFGELFRRVGFIMTNLETAVVRSYNKRGTAEQWLKEGKQAVKVTWLSCHRFRSNEVRLWLSVMAFNLGNLWRRLVKTGGRLVKHARYYWLLLAERQLTQRLLLALVRKIADRVDRRKSHTNRRVSFELAENMGFADFSVLRRGAARLLNLIIIRTGKVLWNAAFVLRHHWYLEEGEEW